MRAKEKDKQYFIAAIEDRYKVYSMWNSGLNEGKFPQESIPKASGSIFENYSQLIFLKYSSGVELDKIKDDYLISVEWMHKSWCNLPKNAYEMKRGQKISHNFYFDSEYDSMLRMLCFGVLFKCSEVVFKKLAEIIDKDGICDMLYEFILSKTLTETRTPRIESYVDHCTIPKRLAALREAVIHQGEKLTSNIEKYLLKDWIKSMNRNGGFKVHEGLHTAFVGYWNFESAAFAILFDIDVSKLEQSSYFPKDLYYYAKANR